MGMIPLLAKQAVEQKLILQSKIMIGNYEFYYACGLLAGYLGKEFVNRNNPIELQHIVVESCQNTDKTIAHLAEIIRGYHPDEKYDEQMEELYQDGIREDIRRLTAGVK